MDTIILKLLSFGVPGIVMVGIYIIWQLKILSILNASDIERLFFTHEKRFIYKFLYWLSTAFLTFIAIFLRLAWLTSRNDFSSNPYNNVYINIFVYITAAFSLIIYFLKDKKWVISIKDFLNKNHISQNIVICVIYVILLCYFINNTITFIFSNNSVVDTSLLILINSVFISLVMPTVIIAAIRIWINADTTYFHYIEENDIWYLIKPHDKDILVGNRPTEKKCNRFRFISFSELKKKDIYKSSETTMSTIYYNKLIRDKIPEIIEKSGKIPIAEILDDESYKKHLDIKLGEELQEYLSDDNINELADLVEVVFAILKHKGIELDDFEQIRKKKAEERGSFDKRLLLKEVRD